MRGEQMVKTTSIKKFVRQRMIDNVEQLRAKKGPYYERWKIGMRLWREEREKALRTMMAKA